MKVQFANGQIYNVENIDEAIAKCLADGNDPFNPLVINIETSTQQETKKEVLEEKNED